MKHKKIRQIAAMMLAVLLVLTNLTGCSGEGGDDIGNTGGNAAGSGEEGSGGEGSGGADSEGRAMGRFLEEELETDVAFGHIYDMRKLEDGTLRVIGSNADNGTKSAWDSKDEGASWEKIYDFPDEIQDSDEGYTDKAMLCADGQAVCVFSKIDSAQGSILPELYRIDKDGNGSRIAFEMPSKDKEIGNMVMGLKDVGNDQLIVQDISDTAYQISVADGSIEQTYEFDGMGGTHQIYVVGSRMIVLTEQEVLSYDTETGKQLPAEEALQKCVAESGMIHAVDTIDAGESMYYLTDAGLYHYKFGGSVMEQIIDGEMNSLGAPAFYPIALAVLDEQNILVAADDANATSPTGISVMKYTYSADTPSKPDKELKVYSLYENRDFSQSISRFRKEHTDVYVNYQVAMSDENGVTLSDALKTLTTEIMAGKGPDLLVLDGMPVETYIEKGILKDLSSLVADSGGNYFENVINAYKDEQGQICAVPARFTIPMAQGGSAYYTPGESFDDFTSKNTLANMDPESVIQKFWYTCSAAWRKEDGTLDEKKITEFLTKLKNAYGEYDRGDQGETVGVTMGEENAHGNMALMQIQNTSFTYGQFELAFGRANTCIGLANGFDYGMMNAVNERLENGDYGLMPGQSENIFVPELILGISSKGNQTEIAEELVKFLLSTEGQKINQRGGFPIEKEAFVNCIDGHEYEGTSTTLIEAGGTGLEETLAFEMKPTPEDAIQKLTEMAESLTTPAFCDDVIKEAVAEQGKKVLKGELEPQEATNAIMQAVNIYLAE